MIRFLGATFLMIGAIFLVYEMLPSQTVDILFAKVASVSTQVEHTKEQRSYLEQELGLNKPLAQRFIGFLKGLTHLDLGNSILSRQPVSLLIARQAPQTLLLCLLSIGLALPLGFLGGLLLAYFSDRGSIFLFRGFVTSFLCIPSFTLASALFVFSFSVSPWIPALLVYLLALVPYLSLLIQDRFLEEEKKPYYRAALSKGLSRWSVFFKHLSPSCIATMLAFLPLGWSLFWGAALIVEPIFRINGLGLLAFESLRNQDLPVLLGISLLVGVSRLILGGLRDSLTNVQFPFHFQSGEP